MTNRKKRLAKGIESLKQQVKIHQNKKIKAEENGLEDLTKYYKKEIEAKNKDIKKKEILLNKQ